MPMQTYDPSKVVVTVWGIRAQEFVAGTFVKLSRDEASFMKHPSADGFTARTRNLNKAGKLEVTLQASSPTNARWSAQAMTDELTGANTGSMQITDISSGNTAANAENAWCEKIPDLERAKELGQVVWTFDLASPVNVQFDGVPVT